MTTRSSAPVAVRLSRRRSVAGVFAGLAAFGFLAAYLVPTTAALAEGVSSSSFDVAAADAQVYSAAADVVATGPVLTGGYAMQLQAQADGAPHVKASLEEWLTYAEEKSVDVPDGASREEVQELIAEAATAAEEATESQAAGTSVIQSAFYTGGGAPADWMTAAGIAEGDQGYVDYIVSRESGWNPNATNASSGACGLVQALPCSKVPGGGYDPVANLQWANGYAVGRYGSWANAYAFWTSNHWW
ncbi:lytic transglycosylase domain-containing protein [Microbacterium marinilacus]|uniref:aggregation-promoting factor C-terminal-like domain-containing protein n=1 Tax=Microbacterium marinilacus TaxID=415209 RepID=UPI001C8F0871|nr:lytic transglycosylase domain-containing protein [Microbacterium marinilacus]MBY0687984.1 lytic transglycosylase domain-containing protein [Microbacterium marinilacus]